MLNPAQVTRQIAYLLKGLTWPAVLGEPTPGVAVFQAVLIGPVDPRYFSVDLAATPYAVVRAVTETTHPEHSEIADEATWSVTIFGPGLSSGSPTAGRLADEIEPLVRALLSGAGIGLSVLAPSAEKANFEPTVYTTVTSRTLIVAATRLPTAPFYDAPNRLVITTSGTLVMTWRLPPRRFDSFQTFLIVKVGSAPTSPTDGFQFPFPVDLATFSGPLPAPGTWGYGVCCAYDVNVPPALPVAATRFSAVVAGVFTV